MPLTRISLRKGKSTDFHVGLTTAVYQAMRNTFDVPEGDRFMVIDEYDESCFAYGENYLGIERSSNLILIEITANNTRTTAQKQSLYDEIAKRLETKLKVRPEDVFINLVEVSKQNWSFGNGVAQYA